MRERAVRMVFEAQRDCGSQWEAISSVAHKLGPTPETVRKWVRRMEVDSGRRPGLTTDERERLKGLERENRELRRANEILSLGEFVGSGVVEDPVRPQGAICDRVSISQSRTATTWKYALRSRSEMPASAAVA